MGWTMASKIPWRVSVPLVALARYDSVWLAVIVRAHRTDYFTSLFRCSSLVCSVFGTLCYLAVSSWVMNEDLLRLLVVNVCNLLDQVSASMGASTVPEPNIVLLVIGILLLVNGIVYSFMLHVLYAMFLRSMGYQLENIPNNVKRWVGA